MQEEDKNIDIFELGQSRLILVGTAHVSKTSAELVEQTIEKYQPDVVALELDSGRFESLSNPERWKETNIYEVVKSGRAYLLLAQLALAGFQKRIASQFGINPGQEMISGIQGAEKFGSKIELIDREVKITMKRAWGNAGFFSVFRILLSLISGIFSSEKMSEEEIEALKENDALTAMMSEFDDFLPGVKDVLIDERDSYMSEKLRRIEGQTIVAVVGAGHVPGMKKKLGSEFDLIELETVPPPKPYTKLVAWGIPTVILVMFIIGFMNSGAETGKEMVLTWVFANGTLAAIGALLALAHPLTILTAFFAAPLTSLNPTIAAGWVCGLVEAILKKPRVMDLELIGDDITNVKGFWSNRVSKILLIIAFANIGSILGTALGFGLIARML